MNKFSKSLIRSECSIKVGATCLALSFAFVPYTASADYFECKDSAGRITMTDVSCESDTEQKEVITSIASIEPLEIDDDSRAGPVDSIRIDPRWILGTWSDEKKKSVLSNSWTFTSNMMVESKSGSTGKAFEYELENDEMVIFHAPTGVEPWQQEVELKYIGTEELEWTELGKTVSLYKISN